MPRSLSTRRVRRLYALYQNGYSVNELAEIFGLGWYVIWSGFRRNNLPRRTPGGCHLRSNVRAQQFGDRPQLSREEIEKRRAEFLKLPKGRAGCRGYTEYLVEAIHADYLACGEIIVHTAKRWNRSAGTIKIILQVRGLHQVDPTRVARIRARQRVDGTGCFARMKRATPAQINAIIKRAIKIAIPAELRWEFKTWPMQKRADFLRRLRAKVNPPDGRPDTPFSNNVQPFDYSTPEARAIKDKLNAGLNSREAICKIDLCSQGVIFERELWFWSPKTGYNKRGVWTPDEGRPMLHRVIWEKHHGRKVPRSHVVRFSDGNPNNFDPENLILATKDDVCRETQAKTLLRKSREVTALLLERSQRKGSKNGIGIETVQRLKAA